ncbi:MAG: hypothetical protein AB1918_10560 [Pseudomonadota bacterium]
MEQNANSSHRVQFDLAAAAYGDRPLPAGYTVVRHYVDPATGFKGAAIDGPNGERHYVVAGTEDGRDALANVNLGKRQYQSEAAKKMRALASEGRQSLLRRPFPRRRPRPGHGLRRRRAKREGGKCLQHLL